MKNLNLSDNVSLKTVSESDTVGQFTISGLYPGYGLTVANALRRVLLSSLPGAAITSIKIKGLEHEFSTIDGVIEDGITLSLNLKQIRFKLFSDEPQTLTLKVKGAKEVTAKDIKVNSEVEILNPDQIIANLTTKSAELEIEMIIEKGLGYVTADSRQETKLSIGTIALDSLFSPVTKVNYTIDNIRVGDKTDYNQINLEVVTDGSIKPSEAVKESANIISQLFSLIGNTF